MALSPLDLVIFVGFVIAVIAVGLIMSRHEDDSESYFLAGRGLSWWLIGFSLIAANISAEQFVGMSGQAAKGSIGLAVASYEWIAAVTLVIVAFYFLPGLLRSGIYTIPEFLEYRYSRSTRTIMSMLMVIIYAGVTIAAVIYMGAKALDPLFESLDITWLAWIVGIAAGIYVAAGGLKACVWADLIQGSALILGGAVIMVLALMALDNPSHYEGIDVAAVNASLGVDNGASLVDKLQVLKDRQMHMVLPSTSDFLPWTALLLGIWIPNFYYWGLNQYIMQRTLGSRSLAHGQLGTVFAASLKLIIPFIVCVPGIIAFTLYAPKMQESAMTNPQLNQPVLEDFDKANADREHADKLFAFNAEFATFHPQLAGQIIEYNLAVTGASPDESKEIAKQNTDILDAAKKSHPKLVVSQELVGYDYDGAFPLLIRYLTPNGLRGFVLAALMGAVISSLASMLNAASTIFTMDLYREYINPGASQRNLVWVGRLCVPVLVVIGCVIAPWLADPKFGGAFAYIQEFQGYISPGILVVFLFGLFIKRAPRICGVLALVLSPVIYGILHYFWPDLAFLNRMAITVGALSLILAVITFIQPLSEPISLPEQTKIEMNSSRRAKIFGLIVVACTIGLYLLFW